MKLSKKSEYALRALVAMARDPAGMHAISTICEDQEIPAKFLEQILLSLRQGGLLNSRRGAGGGYRFNRPPSMIRIVEVIDIVGGEKKKSPSEAVRRSSGGAVDRFLTTLEREFREKLSAITIEDLLQYESEPGSANFEI